MSQPSLVFNNLCLAGHAESASMNNETVCLHVVLEIVNVQVWKRTSYSVNFEALRQLLKTTCTKCSLLYFITLCLISSWCSSISNSKDPRAFLLN